MAAPGRILVVCTANVCRSPIGEHLLRTLFVRHGMGREIEVESAGTAARPGDPMALESARIIASWGGNPRDHEARLLVPSLVRDSSLVLTMEESHRDEILRIAPSALPRTFTWLEFARLVSTASRSSTSDGITARDRDGAGRVRRTADLAHRMRPLAGHSAVEESVADPINGPRAGYEAMAARLRVAAEDFLPELLGL